MDLDKLCLHSDSSLKAESLGNETASWFQCPLKISLFLKARGKEARRILYRCAVRHILTHHCCFYYIFTPIFSTAVYVGTDFELIGIAWYANGGKCVLCLSGFYGQEF